VQISGDAEKHELDEPERDERIAPERQLHDPVGEIPA
jgi:hypothetical protein